MILGEERAATGIMAATLDDLFRRAGVRDPDALALADPPNRMSFLGTAPRNLTYGEADRAISALAARLRELGLQTDSPVATQLPNTVEGVIAFLGILRAGMIAVPLPLLWRREEIVAALSKVSAKAIITFSHIGGVGHAAIAMGAAAELFTVRYVCGFGADLPDGMIDLDDIFNPDAAGTSEISSRPGVTAAHLAAATFGSDSAGIVVLARSHSELVAGGLSIFLECGGPQGENFLSTIPPSSFAGLAVSIMPWLLSGGSLHLHHGFDPATFAEQSRAFRGGSVTLPASTIYSLRAAGFLDDADRVLVALWHGPERLSAAKPWAGRLELVDAIAIGEFGIIAAHRRPNGLPSPIPHGVITAPRGAIGAVTVLETARSDTGTLELRGPMVPLQTFPAGSGHAAGSSDTRGYRDTESVCLLDRNTQTLAVTAPPSGLVSVGGYCFRQGTIEARIAKADPGATVVALPDALLGQRLAGASADRARLYAELDESTVNPLISGAFLPRSTA